MLNAVPLTRDLVLIGGGHAHALVLRSWGMKPLPGVRVTVINPGPTAPYTGMLPGHVAGHYKREDLEIDLMRLCRFAGARLIEAHATGIDADAGIIDVEGRGAIAYDVASIDIGITARMSLPGFSEYAVGAKPLDAYAAEWRAFLAAAIRGESAPQVAVIGAGVAGCELALAMAHAMREAKLSPEITLIEAGPQISGVSSRARKRLMTALADLGVNLRLGASIVRIEAGRVLIDGQDPVPAQFCVGAAGAAAHAWIMKTGLPHHDGFIRVRSDLSVEGQETLFAVGDCAELGFAPRPKAGVFAVRAAPVLYHNLRAAFGVGKRRAFRPQKSYLKLVSLGGRAALADKYGMALSGALLWRWKDRIDRKFMTGLSNLPAMAQPPVPLEVAAGVADMLKEKPLCGGCGAKVGGGVLRTALDGLSAEATGDVITGAGDDAAVLRVPGGGFQVISTDHLRAIIEDPEQMTRIAAVHALGDVWAMGARPQTMLASLILPRMTPALQTRTLGEIIKAARSVAGLAGARLVGGHTTMGAELTIGFTVTGLCAGAPITVAGARPGDVLLLTRPIGAGVIMAAHMAGRAPGAVVSAALAVMQRPQHREAEILNEAHAMTDVTGFGLAGHVRTICHASGVQAELWGDAIPVYDGARALSDKGEGSSLLAANVADAPVEGLADPLLHDPQTAGGLLAVLSEKAAVAATARLQAIGCAGHIIGQLETGQPGRITLRASRG